MSDSGGEVEGWLTLPAAAERFGVKRDRLQKAAMRGRLSATKLGTGKSHAWLVKADDVASYIREVRPGPKPRSKDDDSTLPKEPRDPQGGELTGYERGREG